MLALGIGQSLSEVGHRIVQRQTAYRQLGLFGLFLLVLGGTLLAAPVFFLLLIHHVECPHLRQPGINHGVDRTLARGKVTSDIADEVESLLLTVHVELYACCQHSDSRTDSRHHRHRQHRTYGLNRFTDTLRHLGQTVVVETLILLYGLFQTLSASRINTFVHAVTSHLEEHVFQSLGHLCTLLCQSRVDTLHLLRLRETVVTRDDGIHQFAVETTDVAQVHGQLEGQHVTVCPDGFLALVVEFPPLADNVRIRNAVV